MKILSTSIVLIYFTLCSSSHVLAEKFSDPDYGFSFEFDKADWQPAPIPVSTMGEPLIVLVDSPQPKMLFDVFVRMSTEAPDRELKSVQNKLTQIGKASSSITIGANEIIKIANQKAVSVRMSGLGSGIGIGVGGVPTVQQWTCFVRGKDLIVFQVTSPKEHFEAANQNFQKILKTVEIQKQRPEQPAKRNYTSEETGIQVDYPQGSWIRGGYELGDFIAPGYLLRLWSAKSESGKTDDGVSDYATRLAMFLQFPGKRYEPQTLLDLSITGLTRGEIAKVIEKDIREIATHDAMWLVVEGKSKTGTNLTGQGDVPTRQLWVAIPRKHDETETIVVFLLSTPATDYDARLKEFNKMLESLEVQSID